MTVRQVYYQLVSIQLIPNNRGAYQAVSKALVEARRSGAIDWTWIEDRLRTMRGGVDGWTDREDWLKAILRHAVSGYEFAIWPDQPRYVEAWLEKDALSGIFMDALRPYKIGLNVGRGYDGWSSIHNAAERFINAPQTDATILYFGDFDPSGEDMARSLEERLNDQGAYPRVIKVALNPDDIARYSLPPNFTKSTDSRQAGFVSKFGDVSVELDALPPRVLRDRVVEAVEDTLDMDVYRDALAMQEENRDWLRAQVATIRELRDN